MSKNNKNKNKDDKVSSKYELPVEGIKRDLFKTLLFGIFSVSLLLMMYFMNFGYRDILGLINR